MLWHYLDESGEPGPNGHLVRPTVAGGIAAPEQWQALDVKWRRMLQGFEIPHFHMKEIEAWKPPYNFLLSDGARDYEKHRALLNRALEIIIEHVDEIVGFVAEPEPGKPTFDDAYESAIAKAVKEAAFETRRRDQQITMVFAKHGEFSARRIEAFFKFWNDNDGRLIFGGVAEPADTTPLQVADLLAYEQSRWGRSNRPEGDRYPLERLKAAFREKQRIKSARFVLTYVP